MIKWKYNLRDNGIKLRELINQGESSKENCYAILEQIIVCCQWLKTRLIGSNLEEYDYDLIDIIDNCIDAKCYLDDDEDANEDNINGILSDFYDLMDTMRVWINL